VQILKIKKNDAGQRLDKFLSKAVKGLPMSLMYKYIRTKKIKVNRKRCEQKYILQEGDEIQLFIREEFFDSPEKDDGALSRITPKLDIVYEDKDILVVNKPINAVKAMHTFGTPRKLIWLVLKPTRILNILLFGDNIRIVKMSQLFESRTTHVLPQLVRLVVAVVRYD
jgi:23S rRNA pseudouridine955/2504/2580 synthase